MKKNSLGNWTKGKRLTIRLTEGLLETLTAAAVEERRTVAEIATAALLDWAIDREVRP
jgi:hypothetical protein